MEIILNFKRKDFEELYFRNGNEKLFFSPAAKEDTLLSLAFGALCMIFLALCVYKDKYYSGFFLFLVFFIVQCFFLRGKVLSMIKWRKGIKKYLDKTEMYKINKIVLTEKCFSLIQDTDETIEKWTSFKLVEITEESIKLFGEQNFFIPKKSMKEGDYEILKKVIRDKINQE